MKCNISIHNIHNTSIHKKEVNILFYEILFSYISMFMGERVCVYLHTGI